MASFTRMGSDQPHGASREDSGSNLRSLYPGSLHACLRAIQQSEITNLIPNRPRSQWWGVSQPTTTPAQGVRVYERGPVDNPAVFGAFFTQAGVLPAMLRTIDIPPFTAEAMENNQVNFDGLMLPSCLCSLWVQQQDRRRQLIAEILVPQFPQDRSLLKNEAHAALQVILSDVRNLNNQVCFAETLTELGNQEDGMDPTELVVLQHWNKSERTWAANITLGHQMSVLELISKHLSDRARGICLYPVLLCLMSFTR